MKAKGITLTIGVSGFTLVELLIVIVIMGILAGIAVPVYMGQRTKAMLAEAETNLEICRVLEEQFYAEYGRYAPWTDRNNFNQDGVWGSYSTVSQNMTTYLSGWDPGKPSDLNFEYYVTTVLQGQSFSCYARGKVGGPVASVKLTIDKTGEIKKY